MEKLDLGPTGRTVALRLAEIRRARQMTYAALSLELERLGHPLPTLALRRIEGSARRVSVDDLVALSVALNVSPHALMTPRDEHGEVPTALPSDVTMSEARAWMRGEVNLTLDARHAYWVGRVRELETEESAMSKLADSAEGKQAAWGRRQLLNTRSELVGATRRLAELEQLLEPSVRWPGIVEIDLANPSSLFASEEIDDAPPADPAE